MKLTLAGGMITLGAMYLFEKSNTQPEIGIPVTALMCLGYVVVLIQDIWKSRK